MKNGRRGGLQRADQESASAFEREVSGAGIASFTSLEAKRARLSKVVCRIEFQSGGKSFFGTGFLIGPEWILTNYHVVEELILLTKEGQNNPWSKVRLLFDYDEETARATPKSLHSSGSVCCSRYYDLDSIHSDLTSQWPNHLLDFAILRLDERVGEEALPAFYGQQRGWLPLSEARDVSPGAVVTIFQHPKGGALGQATGNVLPDGLNHNCTRVRYNVDTEPGSSGSPCLNTNLELVAVHHVGDPENKLQPKAKYNQGIPIKKIKEFVDSTAHGHISAHPPPPQNEYIDQQLAGLYFVLRLVVQAPGGLDLLRTDLPKKVQSPFDSELFNTNRSLALLQVLLLAKASFLLATVTQSLEKLSLSLALLPKIPEPPQDSIPAGQRVPSAVGATESPLSAYRCLPTLLGGSDPFLDRQSLSNHADAMLRTDWKTTLLINGTPRTGRSYIYYYFKHLQNSSGDFNLYRISLRELASQDPIVDAGRLAFKINSWLNLNYPFGSMSDVFKIEPFANHTLHRLTDQKTKTLLFIDGFDAAGPTADATALVARLVELAESGLRQLRFALVGFDSTLLGESGRQSFLSITTDNFTEDHVVQFFEFLFLHARKIYPAFTFREEDIAKAAATVIVQSALHAHPNVERVGRVCQQVSGDILLRASRSRS